MLREFLLWRHLERLLVLFAAVLDGVLDQVFSPSRQLVEQFGEFMVAIAHLLPLGLLLLLSWKLGTAGHWWLVVPLGVYDVVTPTIWVLGGRGSLLHGTVWLVVESPLLKLLGGVSAWRLVLIHLSSNSRLYQVTMLLWRTVAWVSGQSTLPKRLVVIAILCLRWFVVYCLDYRFWGLVLEDIVTKLDTLVAWTFWDRAIL